MGKSCWITWEDHRRSRELAEAFGADYVALLHPGKRYVRYPLLSLRTIRHIYKFRPQLVFCQNPSIVLTALLCVLKPWFKFWLVVDRHSNFKFSTRASFNPIWVTFHFLSDFTLKIANLTIVTNSFLKEYIEERGGKAFVLQDKIPNLAKSKKVSLKGSVNFVFISTFSPDEPITEIVEAARGINKNFHVYITGKYKNYKNIGHLLATLPENVTLTGFLPEIEYQELLSSSDVIIVITDQEYTLTCGAYEAVSLEKPMILGNTQTIKEYFYKGAVYVDPTRKAVIAGIDAMLNQLHTQKSNVTELKNELNRDWTQRFVKLSEQLPK